MSTFLHRPVLFHELLAAAEPQHGQKWIDGTFGRGGHATAFLERGCFVLGLDRDAEAETCALELREKFPQNFYFQRTNFNQMKTASTKIGWDSVDGVLLDLGVSSPQFDTPARGFSFRMEGVLDMRMDQTQSLTAAQLIESLSEKDLADLFYQLGDEYDSRRISRAIVQRREKAPITTTSDLAEVVAQAVSPVRRHAKTHPATKVFQALRMAVNQEKEALAEVLPTAVDLLAGRGVLAVIGFHSGEDRYVKNFMRNLWRPIGDRDHFRPTFSKVERFLPTDEEMESNPRSRSARLRVAWKMEADL